MGKNTIFSLFVLNLLFAAGTESYVYAHHNQGCLKQSLVNEALSGLTLHAWNYIDKSWTIMNQINLCDDESVAFKVIKSITYMAELESKTREQKNNLTSIVFKEGPLTFFKSRVKNIYFEPSKKFRKEGDLRCNNTELAFVSMRERSALHICTGNISHETEVDAMSFILLHEARHVDGPVHVVCSHGSNFEYDTLNNTRRFACDNDYESQGSYGIDASFAIDLYKMSTSQIKRQRARSKVVSTLVTNFNKLPFGIEVGRIVASHKRGILFYPYKNGEALNNNLIHENNLGGVQFLPIPKIKPKIERQYHTLSGMTETINGLAINNQQLIAYSNIGRVYMYSKRSLVSIGPLKIADYFRYSLSTKEQASLVDVFHQTFDINYGCLLMSQSMVCMNDTSQVIYRMEFSNIQPQGFYIYKDPASRFESIYLLDKSNRSYPLPNDFRMLRSFSKEQTLVDFSEQDKILNKKNGDDDPFNILSLLNILPSDELIPKLLVAPVDAILQKIKTDSTWILGPFYWSPKIEAL